MALETVEDAQHELQVMIEESIADQFDDAEEADEGSIAADLFVSMCYDDTDPAILAEVARREFGYVPGGAAQAVADAFRKIPGAGEW
jgi:hypothetical protein